MYCRSPDCLWQRVPDGTVRGNGYIRPDREEYCPDWTDEQFREAEILVAGIEHATLNAIDKTVPLETRISGALNTIMTIYNVPEEIRKIKIDKVLAMDYLSIGKRIFKEFKEYVEGMQNSE